MKNSTRTAAMAALVAAILGLIYGLLWMMQTASLRGAPNYSVERAHYNASVAYAVVGVSLAIAIVAIVVLRRQKKRRSE